jgi:hypothetical protein
LKKNFLFFKGVEGNGNQVAGLEFVMFKDVFQPDDSTGYSGIADRRIHHCGRDFVTRRGGIEIHGRVDGVSPALARHHLPIGKIHHRGLFAMDVSAGSSPVSTVRRLMESESRPSWNEPP